MLLENRDTHRSMGEIRKCRNASTQIWSLIFFYKGVKAMQWEKGTISTNDAKPSLDIQRDKMRLELNFIPYHKIISDWSKI